MRTTLSIDGLVPWSVIKLGALYFPPKKQFPELCVPSWSRPANCVAPIYIYCSYSMQFAFVIHKSYLLPSYLCLFPFLFETPVQAQLLVKPLQVAVASVTIPFSLRSLKSRRDGVWTENWVICGVCSSLLKRSAFYFWDGVSDFSTHLLACVSLSLTLCFSTGEWNIFPGCLYQCVWLLIKACILKVVWDLHLLVLQHPEE